MTRRQAVILALALLVSYAYFYQGGGWNQNSRFDLVRALVERGTVRIDDYDRNTGDKAVFEGHVYSDKAPGQALTAVPLMAVGSWLARAAGADPSQAAGVVALSYAATVWAAALPTVLAAMSLAWVASRFGATAGGAAFAAVAYGLATPAWAYATLFWGHALAAGCLAASFAAVIAARDAPSDRRAPLLVFVGAAAGWGVVTEYPAAPATAMIAALAFVHARARGWSAAFRVLGFVSTGGLLAVLVLALYHLAAFGSVLRVGYESVQGFSGMQEGFLGLTFPKRTILQELLLGSFRGLLPLAPVLAAAPVGLVLLWRQVPARAAVVVTAAIALYYLLLNASYYYWSGGFSYGPRHVGAALPFMSLGLAQLWTSVRAPIRAVLVVLVLWGIGLGGMAVSTNVLLPEFVDAPVRELVWPAFARGDLALNRQLFIPLVEVSSSGEFERVLVRGAWNLGQLAGLSGHATLVPLCLAWLVAAVAWQRARATDPRVRARRRPEPGLMRAMPSGPTSL